MRGYAGKDEISSVLAVSDKIAIVSMTHGLPLTYAISQCKG